MRAPRNIVGFLSLLCLGVIWYFSKRWGLVDDLFLPSPAALGKAFIASLADGRLLMDAGASSRRVLLAFSISMAAAVPVALGMYRKPLLRSILAPLVDFVRYLPVPALVPLSILFFGIEESSKVFLLILGTFFQLVVLVYDSFKNIPEEQIELIYSMKLKDRHESLFLIRSVLPEIYDSGRVTIGWCWSYVVIAELVAASSGLGHFIKEAQRFGNTPNLFLGILSMGVIGLVSDSLLKLGYGKLFRYKLAKLTT